LRKTKVSAGSFDSQLFDLKMTTQKIEIAESEKQLNGREKY
jgi:hypothetical protein